MQQQSVQTLIKDKRDQFRIAIRKQKVEEIFKDKRQSNKLSELQMNFSNEGKLNSSKFIDFYFLVEDFIQGFQCNLDTPLLENYLKLLIEHFHEYILVFYVFFTIDIESSHQDSIDKLIPIFRVLTNGKHSTKIIELTLDILYLFFDVSDCLLDCFVIEDEVVVRNVVSLIQDCGEQNLELKSIQALHILIKRCNEYQIQQLMQINLYEVYLNYVRYSTDSIAIILVLESLLNIIQVFSLQVMEYDYPQYLEILALSQNQQIQELSNLILEIFTKFDSY